MSPQTVKQLQALASQGIEPRGLAAVVASYQGGAHPAAILGVVDHTVVSLRSWDHDRLNNYLEGLLSKEEKLEFIEGDFKKPKEEWRKWQHEVPWKFAQMWHFMQSDTKLILYLMTLEQTRKNGKE